MILLTGAEGFVGSALLHHLRARGNEVVGVVRRRHPTTPEHMVERDICPGTDWKGVLDGKRVVIHAAARVHRTRDPSADLLTEYRDANTAATLTLAKEAARAGVERFVFISTVKVNGEETLPGRPFTESSPPAPSDPYGISKREAEEGLLDLAARSRMKVVIVRPPLVYGPGVKAHFRTMLRVVDWRVPLPFGSIHNQRSLVSLDNLVDFIDRCLIARAAENQVFLVSDGEDVSTTELLRRIGRAMDKRVVLARIPEPVIRGIAALLGKESLRRRVCGSLQVDIAKSWSLLGWRPPYTLDDGLQRTAHAYFRSARSQP